jgi:type II restriction/modification system DNA methylase subunit YeeA
VDFIIGNPPFRGDKFMRREMGDDYVERVRSLYQDRIPGQSDLCCYWFEKARAHIAAGKCNRAGLLATQGIRGGANREVLKRIKESGEIFWAESDRPWILDGATVHVSMVGFDNGTETKRTLDGKAVANIHANLTAATDTGAASPIRANAGLCFIGTTKKAPLDIVEEMARNLLIAPNPHGRPNSDVLRPWMNGLHITRREAPRWIIDYPMGMLEKECALYEGPFAYVCAEVRPLRDSHREAVQATYWWRQARPCPDMRKAIGPQLRYCVTPRVAKHRLLARVDSTVLPDCQLVAFARSDDLFFGILHSRIHEVWALAVGTQLREKESGFRYTPSTCFETFPFPAGVIEAADPLPPKHAAIAAAAKRLNELRENWLNPPEWTREEIMEFPGTLGGPWNRFIDPTTVTDRGAFKVGTVRYPRLVARDSACAARLKDRTLTKLYNVRPAWLADCHAKLDAAVAAAYGWPADLTDEAILERLLALNQAAVP